MYKRQANDDPTLEHGGSFTPPVDTDGDGIPDFLDTDPLAEIGVAKQVVGQPVAQPDGSFAVTYEIVVENTGGADLTDVSVLEDLAAEFGPAFVSAGNAAISTPPADPTSIIVLNSAFDGSSDSELIDNSAGTILQIGDSFTLQLSLIHI